MQTTKKFRFSLVAALSLASLIAVFAIMSPGEVIAQGGSICEGDKKLEGSGNTFDAPDGYSITGVCIKAGNNVFDFAPGDPGDGCYVLTWVKDGDCYVSVTTGGGGTGRDCKSISHAAVTWEPGDCKPEPPTKEDCKNGVDDDGDGLVDCDDGDCKEVCEK